MSRLFAGSPGTTAGPVAPPLRTPVARVEQQLALELLRVGAVARVAVLDQERADLLLEELDPLGRGIGSARRDREEEEQSCHHHPNHDRLR